MDWVWFFLNDNGKSLCSVLKVFAQKQAAMIFGCNPRNQCIPDLQPVVDCKIDCGLENRPE
jgi:hypothetical protein